MLILNSAGYASLALATFGPCAAVTVARRRPLISRRRIGGITFVRIHRWQFSYCRLRRG